MNKLKPEYLLILSLTFLLSCQIEKRLYTGGYYISQPKEVRSSDKLSKRIGPHTRDSVTASETRPEVTSTIGSILPLITENTTEGNIALITAAPEKKISVNQKKPANSEKGMPAIRMVPDEENKIEKDVKSLLLASGAVFLLSLLYALFSVLQVLLMVDILFVMLPFSIIGLWIFALTLRQKYFYEKDDKGKMEEKDRIITKKKAFLLAGFLGIFGAHRFYLGYTNLGLFEMFTLGGFFVLYFIDLLKIKSGKLKPVKGEYDNDNSTYTKARKRVASNRSQRLIKLGVLISLLALAILLGFAIFFAP